MTLYCTVCRATLPESRIVRGLPYTTEWCRGTGSHHACIQIQPATRGASCIKGVAILTP